jgi:Right handed beta helix region
MKYFKLTILAAFSFFFLLTACRKEANYITDSSAKLNFSTDTLRFDTVFTQTGSATRYFKVFNNNNQPIKISKITLNNKSGVIFNLNVDGVSAKSFSDIEIPAKDSLYVFAEVTVNPNAPLSTSPFVIDQELLFETNGNTQKVILEAWGQNANYIPNRFGKGGFATLSARDPNIVINWNDPKPYVIYGVLFIDSCTLRIAAGTRIHVHGGISYLPDTSAYRDGIIFVLPKAKIEALGTLEKPIIIEGDRLEKEFNNESDQWAGIILGARSTGNIFNNTIIRNSRVGVRVDSAANLALNSCKIYNTAGSGLVASHAQVKADNCLFYGNGGNCTQLEFGGNYDFSYCTMASLGSREPSLGANNFKCFERTTLGCNKALAYPLSIKATNCIFYGSKDDEIDFFDATKDINTDFNYDFKNCIVRVKDLLKADNTPDFLNKCKDCIKTDGKSKVFRKPSDANYRLDTLSVAEMKALPIQNILNDIEGKMRDVKTPDIGCYEFQYK